jgi:TolB-like protein/Flp pilus assembly protein TadD
MSLFQELNQRNVLRVGAAYAVIGWLLIQIAETIFPLFGFDETPARIVVLVLAIGFVPVLVLAWAFEITPEGLKRDIDVDRHRPNNGKSSKTFDRMIALVLALALAYFAFDKFVLGPTRDAALVEEAAHLARSNALVESFGEHSIAVLPFANLSNDPEQQYFSDGMAEELLNLLAQVPRLRVVSRTSSFAFKGQSIGVQNIAQQLGVNHVLEGSVRRSGDRVRITAQLIEARSDTHLWSQTYERQVDDVFAIQDEISAAIVRELGATLALNPMASAQVRAPANNETHEAYLRGRYLMAQRSPEALAAAVAEFRKAVELDPDYALGHASLAIAIGLSAGFGILTESEAIEHARPHADLALTLDPNLAEAHAAGGWARWSAETFLQAEAHFRRATELNPGYAEAHMWLGHFLLHRRDYVGSLSLFQKTVQLDPLSVPAKNNLLSALIDRGRLDEARQVLEKIASLNPAAESGWLIVLKELGGNWADGATAILGLIQSGDWFMYSKLRARFALMGLDREALLDPGKPGLDDELLSELDAGSVIVLSLLGRPDDAVAAWDRLPGGIPKQPGPGYLPAGVLIAATGDFARAGTMLERAWPIFSSTAGVGSPNRDANFVLALMSARRERGNQAGILELEAALKVAVQQYSEAGLVTCDAFEGCVYFDAGVLAYLDGQREEGLALMARSVESGYFIPANQAYLQFLYDDPEFQKVLSKQRAHQTREREKFLTVVCSNNPYADVWQPTLESCQAFR